jgi:hypothetical protein
MGARWAGRPRSVSANCRGGGLAVHTEGGGRGEPKQVHHGVRSFSSGARPYLAWKAWLAAVPIGFPLASAYLRAWDAPCVSALAPVAACHAARLGKLVELGE